MKRPIRLLVSREHAEQILRWYDDLPAATNTNEDAALAASIERAIESHDEEMERREASEVSTTREVCDHWVGVKGSGHYRYLSLIHI